MDIVETIEHKNKIIKIVHDYEPENPRQWDCNQTTMACFHKRYNLGDKLERNINDLESLVISLWLEHANDTELKAKILKDCKDRTISMYKNILSYADNWRDRFELYYRYEQNIIGKYSDELELPKKVTWSFLYLYDHSGITISMNPFSCRFDSGIVGIIYMIDDPKNPMSYEDQHKIMKRETKAYDDYLTGNCYGYIIEDKEGNELDSCYGFLGDYEYCLKVAKELNIY